MPQTLNRVRVVVRVRPPPESQENDDPQSRTCVKVQSAEQLTVTVPAPHRGSINGHATPARGSSRRALRTLASQSTTTAGSFMSQSLGSVSGTPMRESKGGARGAKSFTFDAVVARHVAGARTKASVADEQAEFFHAAGVHDLVDAAWEGFNVSVFAYGQTGAGKTHTMIGTTKTPGVIPTFVRSLRDLADAHPDERCELHFSLLEIYNEKITDLLAPESRTSEDLGAPPRHLRIREHPSRGPYCPELTLVPIAAGDDVVSVIHEGFRHRKTSSTLCNSQSSRSHAVLTLTFTRHVTDPETGLPVVQASHVNLVDLAGSERLTLMEKRNGILLKETGDINKSLLCLSRCITLLASSDPNKSAVHVPYRDSQLTWLLRESLGGNARTLIIASVNPIAACAEETVNTLRYAARAKRIVNKAVVNVDPTACVIQSLRDQIEDLRARLDTQPPQAHNASFQSDLSSCIDDLDDAPLLRRTAAPTVDTATSPIRFASPSRAPSPSPARAAPAAVPGTMRLTEPMPFVVSLNADPRLDDAVLMWMQRGRNVLGVHPHTLEISYVNEVATASPATVYCRCAINGVRLGNNDAVALRPGDVVWLFNDPTPDVWQFRAAPSAARGLGAALGVGLGGGVPLGGERAPAPSLDTWIATYAETGALPAAQAGARSPPRTVGIQTIPTTPRPSDGDTVSDTDSDSEMDSDVDDVGTPLRTPQRVSAGTATIATNTSPLSAVPRQLRMGGSPRRSPRRSPGTPAKYKEAVRALREQLALASAEAAEALAEADEARARATHLACEADSARRRLAEVEQQRLHEGGELRELKMELLRVRAHQSKRTVDVHFGGGHHVRSVHVGDESVARIMGMLREMAGCEGSLFVAKNNGDERTERVMRADERPRQLANSWVEQGTVHLHTFHYRRRGRIRVHLSGHEYKTLVIAPAATAAEVCEQLNAKIQAAAEQRPPVVRLCFADGALVRPVAPDECPIEILSWYTLDDLPALRFVAESL